MKLTYFTNLYPAISHTFIRREVTALEGLGHDIQRISLRASGDRLVDPVDLTEAGRTVNLLQQPMGAMLGQLLARLARAPVKVLATILWAIRFGLRRGLPVHKMLVYVAEAMMLAELTRRVGSTLVRVHFGTNGGLVARLARRVGGPDYSIAFHGPSDFDAPAVWDVGGMIAEARFVTAISSYCSAQLMRWADPAHWSRIHIVRVAVDEPFLDPRPIPPGMRRACVIGRLVPQKGLPVLVEALARMAGDLHVDIVGDGPARRALEARAAELGVADRLTFHGSLSGEAVRAVIAGSSAIVSPSFAEGLPTVIMEAMAMGRPALATTIAGVPELVREGVNGWLVPAGDIQAFADGLDRLAATPADRLAEMGVIAHADVRARHNLATEAARLDAVLRATDR